MAKVERGALAMTDAECDAFLDEQLWARVATVSPDGEPTVSPVGFVRAEGRLWCYATAASRRGRDVAAGSKVALCVDDGVGPGQGYRERRGVTLYGTARLVPDDDPVLEHVRPAFAAKLLGDAAIDFRRRTHVWFEFTPYRRTSWDFSKIPRGSDRFA